ncbi:alanine racemase [Natronoglycomyces albus]|uniref:Amino acid deaminase n=1 Tax=Natronoglycomyces albus TaxID=2811108 RepID=A0A895XFF3_9ACTN|nr:alanine racemase [Natronoglycomyces albus]QSB04054.1 amino acid deaminase [Natronoglycomyces albus]
MDHAALTELDNQSLDWRCRTVGSDAHEYSIAQWLSSRPRLEHLPTPSLALAGSAVEHNVRVMAQWCHDRGVAIAPHGKATMAPQLWSKQLAAGAVGITLASVAQARVARAFGVRRILIANQVIDAAELTELSRWAADGIEVTHFVDSPAAVAALDALPAGAPSLDVCVELGAPGGRAGARSLTAAAEVARLVEAHPRARLVGVAAYEGVITSGTEASDLADVAAYLEDVVSLYSSCDFATDSPMVTAGGSAYFDIVASVLGRLAPVAEIVLRCGAYLSHDHGFYARLTPFARGGDGPQLRPALLSRSRVLALPEPGRAILDAGRRDLPFDQGLAHPVDEDGIRLPGLTMSAIADQHAFLTGETSGLVVGEVLTLGPSHPCTAFDKWGLIPVVSDDGIVVEAVHTFF